jgi:two-component system sensor kinase FixL
VNDLPGKHVFPWTAFAGRLRNLISFKSAGVSALGSGALLSAMQQTYSGAIIVIDGRGVVHSFNAAAERLFGYQSSEVVGNNVGMLMPPHHSSKHDGYVSRYLQTGEKRIIGVGRVVTGKKKDGSTVPLELSVDEARIFGAAIFVGFIRDLTDGQIAQRRVQELQQELFHVSRLGEMGQLVSDLAHEVNQPLAAILNYLQVGRGLVEERSENAAHALAEILEKIEAQTSRAAEIVKRLRAFIDRRAVEKKREDIATIIEEALALGMVGQEGKGTRVKLELSAGLPDVNVDRVQIQQVIVNLARNALDAMEGSPKRELSISSTVDSAGFVRIDVSDTGKGIAQEITGKLFGAFVTTKKEGMGVGLSISKAIIENHGGRIWVSANAPCGTIFHFTLPVDGAANA